MIVVWDRQPSSGSVPTFNQIFGETNYNGDNSVQICDSLLYGQMSRYKIIYDKMYTLNPDVVHGDSTTDYLKSKRVWIDKFINLKNLESTYSKSQATPAISDISTGALYVIFRAQFSQAGVNQVATSSLHTRLRYVDA